MASVHGMVGIAIVALGLVVTPGPNMIYLLSRTIVQGRGYIVAGGADQFHSAIEGCMIRPGSHESREERMMHVNDPRRILSNARRSHRPTR